MPVLIGIAILILILYPYRVQILAIVAFGMGIGGLVWFLSYLHKKELTLEAKRQKHEDEQQAMLATLDANRAASLAEFEALPGYLETAESLIARAEAEFNDGAFAPFWDAIELAARKIGRFDEGMRTITSNSIGYADTSRAYESPSPQFPIALISVRGMAAANVTTDRMKSLVRTAQRNFQFAMIYEQRKTNQLLMAGFTNLAQALDGMSHRIALSIDELSGQMAVMSSVMQESALELREQLQAASQEAGQSALDLKKRHDRALEMLDNIQRRRVPTPRRPLDGAY